MRPPKKLLIMFLIVFASALLYLLWGLKATTWEYSLPRRLYKLAAFVIAGGAIGFSTVVFQTITNNRILSPAIMGLDSLYQFIQTFVVFTMGSHVLVTVTALTDYIVSVGIMVGFSLILFRLMFVGEGRRLFTIILTCMIFGSLFGSLSTFMQVLIDPNEFLIAQDRMFASFNNVNTNLIGITAIILVIMFVYCFAQVQQLDVISLGRETAVNLGVPYDKAVMKFMIFTAVLVAVSTALVGPVTFLGLLTANLSYQILKTYQHKYLLVGAVLCSVIALTFGQFVIERILVFNTTIGVIINFVGGIYFIYLLIKEGKM